MDVLVGGVVVAESGETEAGDLPLAGKAGRMV